jgi:hypothetical protein
MKLRARWVGPPPRVGDYLMSEVRPRYAYCIARVTSAFPGVTWDPAAKAEARLLHLVVDRIAASAMPKSAKVHPWKWDRREAKAKRVA